MGEMGTTKEEEERTTKGIEAGREDSRSQHSVRQSRSVLLTAFANGR